MKSGFKIGIGVLLVLLVTLAIFKWVLPVMDFICSDFEEDKLQFDAEVWKKEAAKIGLDETERHFMLTDLIENHLKIGMDSSEVKQILGEPDKGYFRVPGYMEYYLGYYRTGFDPTYLTLEFDKNGKLKKIAIVTS